VKNQNQDEKFCLFIIRYRRRGQTKIRGEKSKLGVRNFASLLLGIDYVSWSLNWSSIHRQQFNALWIRLSMKERQTKKLKKHN
jgi:hypothetical protein